MVKSAYQDVAAAYQQTQDNHRMKVKVFPLQKRLKDEVMINFYLHKEMRSSDDLNSVIA